MLFSPHRSLYFSSPDRLSFCSQNFILREKSINNDPNNKRKNYGYEKNCFESMPWTFGTLFDTSIPRTFASTVTTGYTSGYSFHTGNCDARCRKNYLHLAKLCLTGVVTTADCFCCLESRRALHLRKKTILNNNFID